MGKEKKKRKASKKIVALVLVLVFGVLIVIGVYQNQQGGAQKKPAEEYFEIIDPTPGNAELIDNGTILILYEVHFTLKAVGGDAHNVVIRSWAQAEPVYIPEIRMNQTQYVYQYSYSPYGYTCFRNSEDKYPFPVYIKCNEAGGDEVGGCGKIIIEF